MTIPAFAYVNQQLLGSPEGCDDRAEPYLTWFADQRDLELRQIFWETTTNAGELWRLLYEIKTSLIRVVVTPSLAHLHATRESRVLLQQRIPAIEPKVTILCLDEQPEALGAISVQLAPVSDVLIGAFDCHATRRDMSKASRNLQAILSGPGGVELLPLAEAVVEQLLSDAAYAGLPHGRTEMPVFTELTTQQNPQTLLGFEVRVSAHSVSIDVYDARDRLKEPPPAMPAGCGRATRLPSSIGGTVTRCEIPLPTETSGYRASDLSRPAHRGGA